MPKDGSGASAVKHNERNYPVRKSLRLVKQAKADLSAREQRAETPQK